MMEGKRQVKRRKIDSKCPEASDETNGDERQTWAAAGAPPPPGDSTGPGSRATPGDMWSGSRLKSCNKMVVHKGRSLLST